MNQEELYFRYRELDHDLARLFRFQVGDEKKEGPLLPTKENMELLWNTWRELKTQVGQLETPDTFFVMMKHHFQDFLDTLEYNLEDWGRHPENALLYFHWRLEETSRTSRKTEDEKYQELMKALDKLNGVAYTILELICETHGEEEHAHIAVALKGESQTLKEYQRKMADLFPDFSEEQRAELGEKIGEFCVRLEAGARKQEVGKNERGSVSAKKGTGVEHATSPATPEADAEYGGNISTLEDSLDGAKDFGSLRSSTKEDLSRTVKMDPEEYRTLLGKKYGVSLDEILSWNQSEIEKTRAEAFAIAARLDIPEPAPQTMAEVNDILFKYEGPCDSPEEMFERANTYLKRTRALAHEYVKLPDDESCICVKVPDSCKDSYPWGGYEGGDFSVRPFRGQMFLNHHNYRNVTDGWIRLNALHEAYPGHHVQYVRAAVDHTPETVKIGTKNIPMLEGTCLRTERAFEFIYGEDPFFPLFVAYRRHHASVRIYVDLMLFYYGATLEEVVQIYERELGFDRGTARAQVQAHQNMPGYFVCYYYGMRKLSEWEQDYGFSKKDYTELLFSAGYICIDRFEELLKMTPEERERYFHFTSDI